MEKLKNTLPEIDSIFSNMPTDIWGEDFDVLDLDLELYVKAGEMYGNTLYERLQDDIPRLSNLIYNKYKNSWEHLYDALTLKYDVAITSTNKTTISRSEVEEMFNTFNEGQETNRNESTFNTISGKDIRTGGETRKQDRLGTKNLTDKTVLNTSERTSGTDTTDSTKSATDVVSGSDKTTNNLFQQNHNVHYKDYKDRGLGSNSMYLSKQEHDSGSDSKRDTGTSTIGKNETTKTSENQKDVNSKDVNVATSGTDTKSIAGSDKDNITDVLNYNNVTDSKTSNDSGQATGKVHTDVSNQNEGMRENAYDETIISEGSSPLRTFQALIAEEIALRTGEYGNFVDIIIGDVIKMIASKYIEIGEDNGN